MSKDEAIANLDALLKDVEKSHVEADAILLQFLRDNGCEDVANAWARAEDRLGFWYA
jgi:hypothetical protein